MLADQIVKRRTADPEKLGRLRHVGFRVYQRLLQHHPFGPQPGLAQIERGLRLGCLLKLEIHRTDRGTRGHNDGALDPVFEFPHVAAPRMSLDRGKRPGAEAANGALEFRSETSQEIAGEQHRVAGPFAQRRNLHADLVEPVEKILAEPAVVDQLRQVLVRGADHADVDLDRPGARRPARSPGSCRKRSSFTCSGGGMSPISSRNSVPPVAARTCRSSASRAPVNAPFSWPNSSLSSSVSGIAAQLIATNGPFARGLSCVDRAGDQLLAGAALAQKQDRNVGRRHFFDCSQHRLDLRATANDTLDRRGMTNFGKTRVFGFKLEQIARPADDQAKNVGLDRLFIKIVRAQFDGASAYFDPSARSR